MRDNIPESVLEAYQVLKNKIPVRRLAASVPLDPDTTFDIFEIGSQVFLALVTTDYADPYSQSRELKSISGSHGFEFVNLHKPFSTDGETIDITKNNKMEGGFFVTAPHGKYKLYYYLANLKRMS